MNSDVVEGVVMGTCKSTVKRRRDVPVDHVEADPFLSAADELLAEACERTYRRLIAGTLRYKRIGPQRLAALFDRIARDLAERPQAFARAPIPAGADSDD